MLFFIYKNEAFLDDNVSVASVNDNFGDSDLVDENLDPRPVRKRKHGCDFIPLSKSAIQIPRQLWNKRFFEKLSIVFVKNPENLQNGWEFVAYSENTDFYECLSCRKTIRFSENDFYIDFKHGCNSVPLIVFEEKYCDKSKRISISASWWRSKEKEHNFKRTKQFSYFAPQIFIDFQKKMSSFL